MTREPAGASSSTPVDTVSRSVPVDSHVDGVHVLHVIDRLSMGGTQNLLWRSLGELSRRGVESHVCVLSSHLQTDASYAGPIAPTYLDFQGEYRNPSAVAGCVRRLQAVIEDVQPDILHSYLWVSDFVTALANRGRTAAHISHIVDRRDWQASPRFVHRLRRWATRWAFRRAGTRFVAVSQAAKDFACEHMRYLPSRVIVAANGIDCEPFTRRPQRRRDGGPLVLGIAGRLEQEKGHRDLIEALAELAQRGCDMQLKITGDGPLRSELESLVQQRGLSRQVGFLGWVPSVSDFYQSIDVFVVPSISAEGLPTTILEAMASGCVVVASDVGGAAEAIRDEIDGYLVPPGAVHALVKRLSQIQHQRSALAGMAQSARVRVQEQFTTQRMVDRTCESYVAALAARQDR
ncbi:MAG: glycosyltransferase family 4 protein [Planctomycetaceae bacterium]